MEVEVEDISQLVTIKFSDIKTSSNHMQEMLSVEIAKTSNLDIVCLCVVIYFCVICYSWPIKISKSL